METELRFVYRITTMFLQITTYCDLTALYGLCGCHLWIIGYNRVEVDGKTELRIVCKMLCNFVKLGFLSLCQIRISTRENQDAVLLGSDNRSFSFAFVITLKLTLVVGKKMIFELAEIIDFVASAMLE